MSMHITPVVIETMLRIYYYSPESLRKTPAGTESLHRLRKYGLIELLVDDESGCYQCTKRGLCWVNMLLDTPLPISGFVDPRHIHRVVAVKPADSVSCKE